MRKIKLHGKLAKGEYEYALVDDDMYPFLSMFIWYAKPMNHTEKRKVYAVRQFWINGEKKEISMHRLLKNPSPGKVPNHENGLSVDNQLANLENVKIKRNGLLVHKSEKFKGCSYDSRSDTWWCRVKIDGRQIGKGSYDKEVDCAIAWNHAMRPVFGEDVNETVYNNVPGWRDIFPERHVKRRFVYKSNNSGVPGVIFHKRTKKWDANIGGVAVSIATGKDSQLYLGRFKEFHQAVKARRDAELKYWGHTDIPEKLTQA